MNNFQVLAFPCNQFGNQEPAPNTDILAFAREKYQINFPIFSKIDVIGPNADLAFANLIGT
jgi:glutathione peroxidase